MFEKFTSVDSGDFRQRYLGTFGFFRRGNDRPLLTKINAIDARVTFIDKDGTAYTLNPDSPNDIGFEFIPPKAAWHNTSYGAYLVKRVPARQWLRGICAKNTRITTPAGHQAAVDFPMLEQIYGKTFPKADALDLYRKMPKGKTGYFAISDLIAVDGNIRKVWCLDMSIGSFEDSDGLFKITLDDDMWTTEVRDAFRRAELKVEIVE